jgi:hypothetical protein
MWLVESLIVDVTPISRLGESALLAISFRPFSAHPMTVSILILCRSIATWGDVRIAQKKT